MVNIASISSRTPGTGHWWQSGYAAQLNYVSLDCWPSFLTGSFRKYWLALEDPKPPKIAVSSGVAQFDSGDVVGGADAFDGSD